MATIRVLHIISSTMRAGVSALVMNIYRTVDREKIQFDFVAHELGSHDYDSEIESLGGRVFRIPFLSEAGMSGFVRLIRDILEQHGPYAAVHAHTDYQSGFSALAARQAGVPIRICHSHSDTRYIHSPVFWLKKQLGRVMINRNVTQRCACSQNAGISTFGRHMVGSGKVAVVPNGIDLSRFEPCPPHMRMELRRLCQAAPSSRIISFIGRLSREKNPAFMLDMAAASRKAGYDDRFVYFGAGMLLEDLKERRHKAGLEDTVFFPGVRDDILQLMQSVDLVVVPSYSEGFPFVVLEAQAAGTPLLVSYGVPQEADMGLGLFHALPLRAGAAAWAQRAADIMESPHHTDPAERMDIIKERGYEISQAAAMTTGFYGLG